MGSGRPAKRNEPVRSALRLPRAACGGPTLIVAGREGAAEGTRLIQEARSSSREAHPLCTSAPPRKRLWKQRDRARTRRSGVRFPRARPSASGPSLKLQRTRCTGRPMRLACCDSCYAASLACARSRRAAVRWLVCVDAKSAVHTHAPATIGLNALLPAAGATHGPADEPQQRARCHRSRTPASRSVVQRPVVQSFSRSVVQSFAVGPRKRCLAQN